VCVRGETRTVGGDGGVSVVKACGARSLRWSVQQFQSEDDPHDEIEKEGRDRVVLHMSGPACALHCVNATFALWHCMHANAQGRGRIGTARQSPRHVAAFLKMLSQGIDPDRVRA
jgi:hypothetical protein